MAKKPATVGARVRKRGFPHEGTVKFVGDHPFSALVYITVDWDDGPKAKERPRICTASELEVLDG
jgi:hypothetical protein